MARKLRLEFPGACYHAINRGNYRSDIFRSEGAKAAFEACLVEACAKSRWLLHAYVIMSNHYHLAVETPEGNLTAGMQWLQATFANRFNKLRSERGHLFQGRYKSLLVEPGEALGQLCHYIHLNPVRAGLIPIEKLRTYRYSSYWYLWQKRRPKFLQVKTALAESGGLTDTKSGWQAYENYLAWQAEEGPAGKNQAYASLSRGWALGSQEFKAALIKDHAAEMNARSWETEGKGEIQQLQWKELLAKCLRVLGKTKIDAGKERKSTFWKVATAAYLKQRTQASNGWLGEQLHMGSAVAVSQYVGHMHRTGINSSFLKLLNERINT